MNIIVFNLKLSILDTFVQRIWIKVQPTDTLWGVSSFSVVFFFLILLLFALMNWLVLYPPLAIQNKLQLYDFRDINFKLLLVAVAALNFFTCFVLEVSMPTNHSYPIEYLRHRFRLQGPVSQAWIQPCPRQKKTFSMEIFIEFILIYD